MYAGSSRREKILVLGTLLVLIGFPGVLFLDPQTSPHHLLRIAAGCCFAVGGLLNTAAFLVGAWDRNRLMRRVHNSRKGVLWLRLLAVTLWLGVFPLAALWAYKYLQRLQNHV
jgi:hypothetical protein